MGPSLSFLSHSFVFFFLPTSFFHLLGRVTLRDKAEPCWGENDDSTTCLYLRISLCIYVGVHSKLHVHVYERTYIDPRKKDDGLELFLTKTKSYFLEI